jgi:hypothetical protein
LLFDVSCVWVPSCLLTSQPSLNVLTSLNGESLDPKGNLAFRTPTNNDDTDPLGFRESIAQNQPIPSKVESNHDDLA